MEFSYLHIHFWYLIFPTDHKIVHVWHQWKWRTLKSCKWKIPRRDINLRVKLPCTLNWSSTVQWSIGLNIPRQFDRAQYCGAVINRIDYEHVFRTRFVISPGPFLMIVDVRDRTTSQQQHDPAANWLVSFSYLRCGFIHVVPYLSRYTIRYDKNKCTRTVCVNST